MGFITSQNCQLNIPTELNEVDVYLWSMVMDKIFNIKDFSHLKKESTIEIYSILAGTKGL